MRLGLGLTVRVTVMISPQSMISIGERGFPLLVPRLFIRVTSSIPGVGVVVNSAATVGSGSSTFDHFSKDHMLAVEMSRCRGADKELAVVRVGPRIGHREDPWMR